MKHSFAAMGTTVTLVLPEQDEAALARWGRDVAARFERAEARYSRFREDSELSRLNRARGPAVVSAPLFALLVRCQEYARWTRGLFDPAVGGPLAALGYDRSFAPGALDRAGDQREQFARRPGPSVLAARLDPATRSVELPPGVTLDLGGIAKGLTVDEVALALPANAALDAGGDLTLRGAGPEGEGWPVEIEDPRDPEDALALFVASDTAVATSAPNRRRWRVGGEERHHLVDPRTGRSAVSDLAQVTIVAREAVLAEVVSKTVYLLGLEEGLRWLRATPSVRGVLVERSGAVHVVGPLELLPPA